MKLFLNSKSFNRTEEEFVAIKNFWRKEWTLNGKLHRDDGPARIHSAGTQEWWQNGLLHRVDGPARIWSYRTQEWYQNGLYHREGAPAIIWAGGRREWYIKGLEYNDFFDQFFPMINFIKDKYPGE